MGRRNANFPQTPSLFRWTILNRKFTNRIKEMKEIITLLILIPTICFGQWNQIGTDINGQAANEQSATSISLNSNGTILAVGAPRAIDNNVLKGKVRLFERIDSSWIQKGSDIIGSSIGDAFGNSVNISDDGNVVIIGAPGSLSPDYLSASGPTGYARVFEWNGTNWIQRGADILGTAPNDIAGNNVCMNANGSIIGINLPGYDGVNGSNSGAIRIYEWNGSLWIQKGQNILGPSSNSYLGTLTLNASGNIIAIGNASDKTAGNNSGSVKVFEWSGTTWVQKGTSINGDATHQGFGGVLSIDTSGSTFITGGHSFTNGAIGYSKIYNWNGTNWIQKGQTLLSNIGSDFFGTSVDISADGSIAGVSGLTGTTNKGHVRIYKFITNSWVQQGADILGQANDGQFGRSLSLSSSASIFAAGTQYNGGINNNAGLVRVFENLSILPISLMSFTGEVRNTKNILNWTTGNELNNKQFTILKSNNGNDFEPIATVLGAGNNTNTLNYSYTDSFPTTEINYYKLKQTDFNGHTSFSKRIVINNSYIKDIKLLVYPNPVKDYLVLSFNKQIKTFNLKIINSVGELVHNSRNESRINVSHLTSGIYFVYVTDNREKIYCNRIIIE